MSIITLLLSLICLAPTKTGTLIIEVENIESISGELSIGLYDSEATFCTDEGVVFAQNFTINQMGTMSVEFNNIPYGTYALAMYQDENLNGTIDKNFLGIPKEPYAFSNKVRAKWSAPTYAETKFEFTPQNNTQAVSVRYWKNQ